MEQAQTVSVDVATILRGDPPDFSLYREMPLAMQIWNTYWNRTIAYWLQSNGVDIVPNVRWGDERTYRLAFEGLQMGGWWR